MAWYAVDLRDRVVQRVTEESNDVDSQGRVRIEAGSAKRAGPKPTVRPFRLAVRNANPAATVFVVFVKNAPSQNNARTIGFVTAAAN